MKIRSVVAVCVIAVGLTVPTVVHAAPVHIAVPVHTIFNKIKIVNVSLRNDSGAPLELKVGDAVMTLNAGEKVALKLPAGTRILANATTSKYQAGLLFAEVAGGWDDVTIGLR